MRVVTFSGRPVRRQSAVKCVEFCNTTRAIKSLIARTAAGCEVEFWRDGSGQTRGLIPASAFDAAEKKIRVKYYNSDLVEYVEPEEWDGQKQNHYADGKRREVVKQFSLN